LHNEAQLYRLPFTPGHSHKVIQGWDGDLSHHENSRYCVDFAMPEGSTVVAARQGRVVSVVDNNRRGGPDPSFAKYANYIVVLHDDGTTGEYYHLQYGSAKVRVGDFVLAGSELAASGNTGFSTTPHLHFGVYVASDWGQTLSVPTHFVSEHGIHRQLYQGMIYTASDHEDLVDHLAPSSVAVND
jgi:murein DD-endopeptidase MepM/ murein hydrolase activator NlpD